jgi:hypothetical protein
MENNHVCVYTTGKRHIASMAGIALLMVRGSGCLVECLDKVPWFRGLQPREVYSLDDPEHLKILGLTFREGEKRADYYICSADNTWSLIERKAWLSNAKAIRIT